MGTLAASLSSESFADPLGDLDLGVLYDMLTNHRRRMVLHFLVHTPGEEATIGELAEQLAAWENGVPVASINSKLRKRTYNTLQQNHLPRLDEAGLVAFDRARGWVQLTADAKQLNVVLGVLPRVRTSWLTRFLLLGTVFWFALLLNWLGVHVFHVLPPGTATYLFGASFAALFGVHSYLLYRFFNPKKVSN